MLALMLAAISPAMATPADLTLDVKVTDPGGEVVLEESVPLPYSQEVPLSYGKHSYVLALSAIPEGREVELVMEVLQLDGDERVKVTAPSLTLVADKPKDRAVTTAAPRGFKTADGQKLSALKWSLSGGWRWGAEDWAKALSDQSIPEGDTVLLREDSWLYAAPEEGAPKARLGTRSEPGAGGVLPMTVVKDQGGWLELQTLAANGHCHDGADNRLRDIPARFHVQRSELLLSTHQPVEVAYSDGTSGQFEVGVAAWPVTKGLSVVDQERVFQLDDGLLVTPAALPKGSLAMSYQAVPALKSQAVSDQQIMPTHSNAVGGNLAGPSVWLGQGRPAVQGQFEVEGGSYTGVQLEGRCSAHNLKVQPARIKPAETSPQIAASTAEAASGPPDIELRWPDNQVLLSTHASLLGISAEERGMLNEDMPCLPFILSTRPGVDAAEVGHLLACVPEE